VTIMVATTRITVRRPDDGSDRDPDGDGYDTPSDTEPVWTSAYTGVRATIIPSAGRTGQPGDAEFVAFQLACDPIDLRHTDLVDDETTGDTYRVEWAETAAGVAGLGHTVAGLSTVTPELGAPE
jgi:hypothetical protein